jgi:hypothetical protein
MNHNLQTDAHESHRIESGTNTDCLVLCGEFCGEKKVILSHKCDSWSADEGKIWTFRDKKNPIKPRPWSERKKNDKIIIAEQKKKSKQKLFIGKKWNQFSWMGIYSFHYFSSPHLFSGSSSSSSREGKKCVCFFMLWFPLLSFFALNAGVGTCLLPSCLSLAQEREARWCVSVDCRKPVKLHSCECEVGNWVELR